MSEIHLDNGVTIPFSAIKQILVCENLSELPYSPVQRAFSAQEFARTHSFYNPTIRIQLVDGNELTVYSAVVSEGADDE